jgi:hypothetical protein
MAAVIDNSVGLSEETTHKTYVAPARHYEYNSESLKWTKNPKNGRGIRVGSRVARSSRRVIPTSEGSGDFTVDAMTRGMGVLWDAAFGQNTNTEVGGSGEYQQVFTFADTLASYTIQRGVVRADGTPDAASFLGCVCSGFELDSPNGEILTAKFMWDIADVTHAQSYVTPSYPTEGEVLHFGQVVAEIGGTITAPTTTALASMASEITVGVRDFNLSVNSNLDNKRFNYGGGGRKAQQIATTRQITGKFTAEYDQTTLRDAFLNDTDVPLLITATGANLGTNDAVLQIVLPVARLNGDLPEAGNDGITTIEHSFEVFDGLSQSPLSLVCVTADTTI